MTVETYWSIITIKDPKDERIKALRKIAGGDTYFLIYHKMMSWQVRCQIPIFLRCTSDNIIEALAKLIDEEVENVEVVVSILERKGLLAIQEEKNFISEDTSL
ncbi:phage replisome organizer N-terminal domain-containing protein [Aerococcus sp. UMB1112A]|uniref:phage replisome organizer N-terminal domain-containing protein n=1 Tax=Aerococcus sp. UMB1112A TaxID=3050609 RepID=UPI0025505703|nr:phage replisome organizer N-terminal domain-containing protein [Aerococcus sp. UMB1112A]MDK8502112.1 phage replisome organizer N-terminal domain-containing protein [Aerococcus sp. UMB1112A]